MTRKKQAAVVLLSWGNHKILFHGDNMVELIDGGFKWGLIKVGHTKQPTWMAEIQNQGLQGKTSNDSLCSCAFNFQLIPKPITLIFNTYINASTYVQIPY